MRVDLGNALDTVVSPGIQRDALDRLDERVADAHERIETGRENHDHGYESLNLPETTDTDEIQTAVESFADAKTVLTVGIGGSALGAATLAHGLESDVDAYFLDNVDPEHVSSLLDNISLSDTAVNVVSRSGTTAETLTNFLVVRDAMESADVDWTERTFVTTGEEGNLRNLANRHNLPALDVPDGVPGRFSVLSTVGLACAAIQGHDIGAVLSGARAEANRLSGSLFESPAYAYGTACYALDERGAGINAMMPYAESLETFAEWFAQLWAESLGKDGLGQTPVRALGATDQHSQLQLYRAGPRDKMVTFVRPTERDDCAIPETDLPGLEYLGGQSLGTLLDAEFEATEASLAESGQPSVRLEIDRVDEYGLGELLYCLEASCILAGELYSVETFTQPAVEWGKRAARGLLGDGDFDEADSVADKSTFVIE
ncbi:glucose-6-phosphate isomerase [Haladaptatus pallidirubidus]|uniref:Probable glucose-6-phosphate isomerase n=1 Tax=Haladaptatus pallidirubidus TaxID=1008152 RepID=A0AAV3UFN1_9EURY|nr:glucose-6-phosphate isomerase [Haladaptatus pallidirubidus]